MDTENRLMVKVCRMYYLDNMTQQEIAKIIGVSRSKISRLLSRAREEGIVRISITDRYSEEQQCEAQLCYNYKLSDAVIIDDADCFSKDKTVEMAGAVTQLFDSILKDNDTIGVMAGYTTHAISEHLGYIKRNNLHIVPLVGGLGSKGENYQSEETVKNLADRLNCTYSVMNAPACVSSVQVHDILMKEPEIEEVFNRIKTCSVALVGIGQIADTATILHSGALGERDMAELESHKAVASLCGIFLDQNGKQTDTSVSNRMICVDWNILDKIPKVIAVAHGLHKTNAIESALNSGLIDILITDLETAKSILHS